MFEPVVILAADILCHALWPAGEGERGTGTSDDGDDFLVIAGPGHDIVLGQDHGEWVATDVTHSTEPLVVAESPLAALLLARDALFHHIPGRP